MAKSEIKPKVSIGSSSLILIFIILCLATFALLSLSNAGGDWRLAERNANAVKVYYAADAEGEEFVRRVDRAVAAADAAAGNASARSRILAAELGAHYQADTQTVVTDIGMDFDQALHIELILDGAGGYRIGCWKVYNQKDYEIDTAMPVWTGE